MDIFGISTIVGGVKSILDKFIHSPEDKAQANLALGKIQHSAVTKALEFEITQVRAQADIIIAEAKSGWLSRSWRPILMFVFMAIIINNFIIWPYSAELGIVAKQLDFPVWMQDLLKLAVGGYIGGRSAEKIIPATVAAWKGTKSKS